ncbi:MAG: ATP-binding protein [Granulosicoccus sp.]
MNRSPLGSQGTICQLILTNAFPFHLVIDSDSKLIGCGHSIRRILPFPTDGSASLFEHFTIQHPADVACGDDMKSLHDSLFFLKSTVNPLVRLRGQMIKAPATDHIYFIVSPWVTDLDVLEELGLTLSDFPLHSPMSDFLMLLQTQKASLAESKRLAADLSELNKELEERVKRRTQALERNTQELRESKQNLEFEMNERTRVEIELRHAQKLESVGQLAAGIAHEINTPMQYVSDSLQFIKSVLSDYDQLAAITERLMDSTEVKKIDLFAEYQYTIDAMDLSYTRERAPKSLERALDGISAVTKIVRAMNEFTHPDGEEKCGADINRALEVAAAVAKNEYKYVAKLHWNLQPIPSVECHLGDLNQVFLNLIVNAAHAISDSSTKDGRITISTAVESDVVIISIADNGGGIPEKIKHRVFDPFFTTKEVGRGTGQGLTISHNIIVYKHGGKLEFLPNSDNGTTFIITLPVSPAACEIDPMSNNYNGDLAA